MPTEQSTPDYGVIEEIVAEAARSGQRTPWRHLAAVRSGDAAFPAVDVRVSPTVWVSLVWYTHAWWVYHHGNVCLAVGAITGDAGDLERLRSDYLAHPKAA